MTSGVAHNDWLIGYMDHNDYDSRERCISTFHSIQLSSWWFIMTLAHNDFMVAHIDFMVAHIDS